MPIDRISGANSVEKTPVKSTAKDTATEPNQFSDIFHSVSAGNDVTNLDQIFDKASKKYDVPVSLLKAVAKAESNFNPKAQSGAGAQGIMQLMPATARGLGVNDPFDPEQNIMGGANYLSQMLHRFDGNTELALAAYNAGPGNVAKYGGIPPFAETQKYVTKVMGFYGNHSETTVGLNLAEKADSIEMMQLLLDRKTLSTIGERNMSRMSDTILMELLKMQLNQSADISLTDEQTIEGL